MQTLRLKAPASVVADYFRLFVNRRAYTLQSNRPHPESGRHYYYRPKDKKTGQGLSLTLDTIRHHLEGEITIGLYAINPATQCSKWVAIDADYQDALTDLARIRSAPQAEWSGVSASRTAVVVGTSGSSLLNHCQPITSGFMSAIWPCGSAFRSNTASSGKASRSFPSRIS